MSMIRAILLPIRLAWPHLLAPWRSPLLRWRMETYGIQDAAGRLLHAEEITARDAARFLRRNARSLLRFFRWAATL